MARTRFETPISPAPISRSDKSMSANIESNNCWLNALPSSSSVFSFRITKATIRLSASKRPSTSSATPYLSKKTGFRAKRTASAYSFSASPACRRCPQPSKLPSHACAFSFIVATSRIVDLICWRDQNSRVALSISQEPSNDQSLFDSTKYHTPNQTRFWRAWHRHFLPRLSGRMRRTDQRTWPYHQSGRDGYHQNWSNQPRRYRQYAWPTKF